MLHRRDFLVSSALGLAGGLTGLNLARAEANSPAEGETGRVAAPYPIKEILDVRYQNDDNPRHRLDVFSPRGLRRTPVVLFVHGGTWMAGDKDFFGQYRSVGRFLAHNGVTAVLTNYRLSPLVKHPEHARDVARAFAWTLKNIARHGGDPERVVLCGHSAGGHLAALIATDPSYLADPELKLRSEARKAIKGVVGVCGVYRVPGPEEFRVMLTHIVRSRSQATWMTPVLMKVGEIANPFAMVFGTDREVQEKASPITHIHKGLPPFLVLYATSEVPGLAQQAVDFGRRLAKVGTEVEVRQIPEATHRTIMFHLNKPTDPTGKALLDFVHKTTAGETGRSRVSRN